MHNPMCTEQEDGKRAFADEAVKVVLRDAFSKYRAGARKHGEINIDADPRNFLKEAEQELLDSIVYTAFEILRLRRVEAHLNAWAEKRAERAG